MCLYASLRLMMHPIRSLYPLTIPLIVAILMYRSNSNDESKSQIVNFEFYIEIITNINSNILHRSYVSFLFSDYMNL